MSIVLVGAGEGSLGAKVAEAFGPYDVYRMDIKGGSGVVQSDATDPQFVNDFANLIWKVHPNVIVNFVGAIDFQPLKDLDLERFNGIMKTNMLPLVHCAKALAHYDQATCFIQIGSNAASYPFTGMLSYSTAKAAQKQAIKIMAKELAPRIRVNMINPGPMEPQLSGMSTNQIPLIFGAETPVDEAVEKMKARIPLKRLCTMDDLVTAIRYLGYSANFVTGQALELSGGQIL